MKKFLVTVCRTEHRVNDFEIEANTPEEAALRADSIAGHSVFAADSNPFYEVTGVYRMISPKKKPKSPFGPGWTYVSCEMRTIGGVQYDKQLWKNKKTGKLTWHTL